MLRSHKLALAFLLAVGSGSMSGIASDADHRQAAPVKVETQWSVTSVALERIAGLQFPRDYSVRAPQHGTHLCSRDEHCGTGHKCCSGHCKAVVTC